MDICYTFDNNYIPQIATSICSICENNKSNNLIFHLIGLNLTEDSKDKLKELVKSYNKTLYIYDLPPLKTFFDFEFDTGDWPPIILARLIIDRILPNNIGKILYIDGDTIVRGNLSGLWDTYLNNKTIGMVGSPIEEKRRIKLCLKNYIYHNSGVCLIDFQRFIEKDFGTKMVEYYKTCKGSLYAADQDLINIVLKDEIYELLPSYNYGPDFYETSYRFVKNNIGVPQYFSKDVYDEVCNNPIIIHYYGVRKPRRKGSNAIYQEEYDIYSQMAGCNNLEDGWKFYFWCLNLFDLVFLPFPEIRWKIISLLSKIKLVIKYYLSKS